MDIRKYFGAGQSKKTTKELAAKPDIPKTKKATAKEVSESKPRTRKRASLFIDSDSDEDPVPKKKISKQAKKTPVIIDESDEDERPVPRSSPRKKPTSPVVQKKVAKTPPKVKPVSAADFFGSEPVRRSSRTPQKKDENQNVAKKNDDEYEIHDDDDFKETLKALDNGQTIAGSPARAGRPSMVDKLVARFAASEKISALKKENKLEANEEKKSPENIRTPSPQNRAIPIKQPIAKKAAPPSVEKKPSFYQHYLQREGPRAPGSKEIPEGKDGCLERLTFVITGVLESLEREEATDIIKKYGGKVTQSLSKSTRYIIVGRDAGPSKLEKANSLGTKQLDEDGLLDMIRTLPGTKQSAKSSPSKTSTVLKTGTKSSVACPKEVKKTPEKNASKSPKKLMENNAAVQPKKIAKTPEKTKVTTKVTAASPDSRKLALTKNVSSPSPSTSKKSVCSSSSLWVDKYKPVNTKQIIGQHGDKSNVKKLMQWLTNWHKNNSKQKKVGTGKWKTDDGSNFKAALLSGPPGVGKTTSAQLVCKEAGFTFIELNASDTRSKKNLQEVISKMLQNKSLSHYLEGSSSCAEKHCLLMDEVDGMAGNEDRGGVQELIQLIKHSKIPIICMCNDRNHQKIRSLSNYCFDLRFSRPRVEQLKGAMLTICFKEGITIPPIAVQEIIVGANQDVRQIIHHLCMWSVNKKRFTEEDASREAKKAKKDMKIGPFDVLRMVFSSNDHKTMNFHDKSNLFFHDYSLAPLFVQENYPFVQPAAAQNDSAKHLQLLSKAADSICDGDLVDKLIRSEGHWSLLPVQAVYASVIPGDVLEGHLSQMIAFPSWLGRNSTRGKNDRLLQELLMHMRLKISGNKTDLNCDYLQYLRNAIANPLVTREQEGIPDSVATMNEYYLMRDDLDSVFDVSLWPNQVNPLSKLSPQLKAAFTRAYNKGSHLNPYAATIAVAKGRRVAADSEEIALEGDELEEEDEEQDDIMKDAMIKKKTAPKRKAKDQDEPSTSKKSKGPSTSKKSKRKGKK